MKRTIPPINPQRVISPFWLLAGALALGALPGCGDSSNSDSDTVTGPSATIEGVVVDLAGVGIADATVEVRNSDAETTTNASGGFVLKVSASAEKEIVLATAAVDFGPSYRRLTLKPDDKAYVSITLVQSEEFNLSFGSAGATDASVKVVGGNSSMTFTVPPNSLKNEAGEIITSGITASVTYWNPDGGLFGIPGELVAFEDNAYSKLQTFGMADIVMRAAGQELQVVDGARIKIEGTMPAEFLAAIIRGEIGRPDLYWFNPDIGYWEKIPGLVMDDATGNTTGYTTHLSAFNLDHGGVQDAGGCVCGDVKTACGIPVIKPVPVELVNSSLGSTGTLLTDANGHYCMNSNRYGNGAIVAKVSIQVAPIVGNNLGAPETVTKRVNSNITTSMCASCNGVCTGGRAFAHREGEENHWIDNVCECFRIGDCAINSVDGVAQPDICSSSKCGSVPEIVLPELTRYMGQPCDPNGFDTCCPDPAKGAMHCCDRQCVPGTGACPTPAK